VNHPDARATKVRPDLVPVHERLRAILEPYRQRLTVASDGPTGMSLELPGYEGDPWGFAAATRLGSRYVSFYLMGVYGAPELLDSISPALRARMQGKSCFNFTRIDEPLFAELAELTARSIARQPAVTAAALAAQKGRKR
jgi:hypothetical protein